MNDIKNALRNIGWLHALHIWYWKNLFYPGYVFVSVAITRIRNWRNLKRIRSKIAAGGAAKVVFLVSEVSKWKCQSVYDAMKGSARYDPIVVLFPTSRERESGNDLIAIEEKLGYFSERGVSAISVWNHDADDVVPYRLLNADIVFYQQPWEIPSGLYPTVISGDALLFYVPYYLPDYLAMGIDVGESMVRYLFRYVVLNETMADALKSAVRNYHASSLCHFVALGHPMLDTLYRAEARENMVIYAPHWTFEYGDHNPTLHYSTFLENGQYILEFAKKHPEIVWVFKPHPLLRYDLVRFGAMTKDKVDEYYAEWERLGPACYDADYTKLFARSRAMITDCGSFLTEYAVTGNPIIHPMSSSFNVKDNPVTKKLFSTYYETHNNDELGKALNDVVLNDCDPNREERLKVANEMGLMNSHAAVKILSYLDALFLKE